MVATLALVGLPMALTGEVVPHFHKMVSDIETAAPKNIITTLSRNKNVKLSQEITFFSKMK
jgi:hypothetical protein